MAEYRFDITFLGHFSKDIIITPSRRTEGPGGAVYYGSIPAARLGLRVAVITRTAKEDLPLLKPMEDAGVKVFPVISETGTSIENSYLDATLERRVCRPLGFAGSYETADLPDIKSEIWHVAGLIRGETDIHMLRHLAALGRLSTDAQGFVRVIRGEKMLYEDWPDKRAALPLLEFFKTDAAEAEVLTGHKDIHKAAETLASWGAREVVLTHQGGLMTLADGKVSNTPFRPRVIRGRTGRGDTCMSSYLARRLTHPPGESGRFAAALCSLKMEHEGPFSGAMPDVLALLEDFC